MRKKGIVFSMLLLLSVTAVPGKSHAGFDMITFGVLLAGGVCAVAGLGGAFIFLDAFNGEATNELQSPRMLSQGLSVSAGGLMCLPGGFGPDMRFSIAAPIPNLEFGMGYGFMYSGSDVLHSIRLDTLFFPFHKLTKGIFIGANADLVFWQNSLFGSNPPIANLLVGILAGYRFDLFPLYLQPEIRFENTPLSFSLSGGRNITPIMFSLEAGYYF